MSTTIRRVIVSAAGVVEVRRTEAPEPAPGEALVRLVAVGVCGSDVHAAHGHHPFISLPYEPGHEVVGVVEQTGPDVALPVGTRVVVEPVHSCGHCKYCLDGRNNLCTTTSFFGCSTPTGGMADLFVIPAEQLLPVPDALSELQAVLIEPLATPVHAVRLAADEPSGETDLTGKAVAILGAGTIGLLTLAVVRRAGAKRIAVSDLSADKRDRALRLGADALFDPTRPDFVEAVRDDLSGSADIVFDCVALQSTIDQAVALAIKGGTVMVVGVPARPVTVPLPQVQDLQVRLQGSATFTDADLLESMRIIEEGLVRPEDMITARFDLDQAAAAFDSASRGDQIKVVVLA